MSPDKGANLRISSTRSVVIIGQSKRADYPHIIQFTTRDEKRWGWGELVVVIFQAKTSQLTLRLNKETKLTIVK